MTHKTMTLSAPAAKRLRTRYDKAVERGEADFKFTDGDGQTHTIVTGYAKYLLEYING